MTAYEQIEALVDKSCLCNDGLCDNCAALLAAVKALAEDAERLDWLDMEHQHINPIARLVVKYKFTRNIGTWVDCVASARASIDAARSAASAAAEGKK